MGYVFVLILCGLGIPVGLFIFLAPATVIKLQIKFYEKINWWLEPVSMFIELRNTKAMGLFLVMVCLWAIVYIKFMLK